MTNDRPQLRFGYFLIPNHDDPLIETAQQAEQLGLDYIGIQDHPYQRRYVETWALMAMIAASTERISIFPDVSNLPLRQPAVLAKTAATISSLSGGRFDLGLGAGAFWDAIVGYGGPRRTPEESLDALIEAITVIKMMWSGERGLRFEGEYYQLDGAHSGPAPPHPLGIWLGAYGPRSLRITAEHADGWVPSFRGDMDQIAAMSSQMTTNLDALGRDAREFRRIINVNGQVMDTSGDGPFYGPPEQWVHNIMELALTHQFDTFIFWGDGDDQLARFAEEVAPAAREAFAAEL